MEVLSFAYFLYLIYPSDITKYFHGRRFDFKSGRGTCDIISTPISDVTRLFIWEEGGGGNRNACKWGGLKWGDLSRQLAGSIPGNCID